MSFAYISAVIRVGVAALFGIPQVSAQSIKLLECFSNGGCEVPTAGTGPLGVFGIYFNSIYPWVVGMAAGIALLWALIGGIQMMMSGGDSGKRGEAVTKIQHAVLGLLMIIFAATILNFINPTFFQ